MQPETLKALRNVIDYLYTDEQKHYEEEGKPTGHIFESLILAEAFISAREKEGTPATTKRPLTYADISLLTWKWYKRGGNVQIEKDLDTLKGYADTRGALDTFSKLEVLARTEKAKLFNKPIA